MARRTDRRRSPGRERCRALYPDPLGICERGLCASPAVDRHHKDENTWNNERSNVEFLCRHCHNITHGKKPGKNYTPQRLPPRPCVICCKLVRRRRKGRCHTCDRYLTMRGKERPYKGDGRLEKTADVSRPC